MFFYAADVMTQRQGNMLSRRTFSLSATDQVKVKHQVFCLTGRFHSGTNVCLLLDTVSERGGASFVRVVPAPTVAPTPTLTGATSSQLVPIKASS